MSTRLPAVAAIGLAAVLAACGAQPTPTPSDPPPSNPPPSVAPSATLALSPSPSQPPAVIGYEPAAVPETESASAATIIVPGGEGLVAIGFNGGFGSILWTSGDGGATWTDITPEDFAAIGIASVVEYDGMLVGVGRGNTIDVEAQEAAVYLSDDGTEWRKVETAEQLVGQMIDVIATDDGLYAVGGVPGADSAGVWHSTDAETWERVGDDFEHAFLWSIADGGPGLVAAGWRRNPEPDLAVWTSADAGASWQLSPDPEGFAGFEATDVTRFNDTLVMAGSAFDGSGGRLWSSTDGVTWDLTVDDMGTTFVRTLTETPAGLIGTGGDDEMRGRAWLSIDGVTWEPLGDPLAEAYFQSAFATDAGLIFAGGTQTGTLETGIDARAMIWTATIAE